MKRVTLNFREIAKEGLPEKSGYYLALHRFTNGDLEPSCYMYSAEHKLFNVYQDPSTALTAEYWMPMDEYNKAVSKL